ncbi:hypothetical protein WDU94_010544, partial [Cyamophila willieti]
RNQIISLPQLFRAYDFIVIGAGSAGAVVANRLSENPDWKILLIEAGGDENEISDIPSLAGYLQLSELDWKYKTEPPMGDNAYCLAMVGDRCNWPRGKVLGGSSVLNAMIYVRGNRHDYDQWEKLGNPAGDIKTFSLTSRNLKTTATPTSYEHHTTLREVI